EDSLARRSFPQQVAAVSALPGSLAVVQGRAMDTTVTRPSGAAMSLRPDLGPRPRLGYAASRIDRAAIKRADPAALAAPEQDAPARTYAIAGELVVLRKTAAGPDPLFVPAEARGLGRAAEIALEVVFLGLYEGHARFAVALDAAAVEALKSDERFTVTDL